MRRCVFYSFHYVPDNNRVAQIRNMGVVDGNKLASDNDWESIKRGGEKAIQTWIDGQLDGKSCAVVLIGANTAGRKWINYEIESSWNKGKGLLGIHIHGLKDLAGNYSAAGANPFSGFSVSKNGGKVSLSTIVKAHYPPYGDSKQVYAYIKNNFAKWIEEAIAIRNNHRA